RCTLTRRLSSVVWRVPAARRPVRAFAVVPLRRVRLLLFPCRPPRPDLRSFPTRRSSDLPRFATSSLGPLGKRPWEGYIPAPEPGNYPPRSAENGLMLRFPPGNRPKTVLEQREEP